MARNYTLPIQIVLHYKQTKRYSFKVSGSHQLHNVIVLKLINRIVLQCVIF